MKKAAKKAHFLLLNNSLKIKYIINIDKTPEKIAVNLAGTIFIPKIFTKMQ